MCSWIPSVDYSEQADGKQPPYKNLRIIQGLLHIVGIREITVDVISSLAKLLRVLTISHTGDCIRCLIKPLFVIYGTAKLLRRPFR